MGSYAYVKYALDFVIAIILLVLTCWILAICALVIKLDEPKSPVMYNAIRIGKDLRPFKMYKFRTMKSACTGAGRVTESTLTKPGKTLRKLSLDELPQLLNIIRGEMSFIGPRPLTERYVPWYTKEQNIRHSVRPGLTGLAQIKGRANLGWDKRFKLDVEYVNSMSLLSDIKIVMSTVHKVITGDDYLAEEEANPFDYFDDFQRDQVRRGLVREADLISDRCDIKEPAIKEPAMQK
jgi:lipopolysaccharide/colanic/teichoic acid biosynthesis glycosyltransferase